MTYNITMIQDINSPIGLLTLANSWTNDLFGLFLLVVITASVYFGLRGGLRGEPSREAMSAALFVGAVTSVFFVILGFLDTKFVAATVLLFAGAVAMLINRN